MSRGWRKRSRLVARYHLRIRSSSVALREKLLPESVSGELAKHSHRRVLLSSVLAHLVGPVLGVSSSEEAPGEGRT